MINPRRQNNQIILLQRNAHPPVPLITHVKVPPPVAHITDLLVLVQVLVKEGLHFRLVDVAHALRRHRDLVAVLVPALRGQGVDAVDGGDVEVEYTERGEVGFGERGGDAGGVVGEALVALGGWVRVWVGFRGGLLSNLPFSLHALGAPTLWLKRKSQQVLNTYREIVIKVGLHFDR